MKLLRVIRLLNWWFMACFAQVLSALVNAETGGILAGLITIDVVIAIGCELMHNQKVKS